MMKRNKLTNKVLFHFVFNLVLMVFIYCFSCGCTVYQSASQTFHNPILSPQADPWIVQYEGKYYFCESTGRSIHIRETADFTRLQETKPYTVWRAPEKGPYSQNVWAPELHFIKGHWYIYFAADDGHNENHRMYVLKSKDESPLGPYIMKGKLETEGWAIDGTVWQKNNNFYFIWSGWPVEYDVQQNLYIALMKDPWTLQTTRRLIAEPDQPYEQQIHLICEGPVILENYERTFLFYSASASWTKHYCLAYMEYTGEDPLERDSWTKKGVFMKSQSPVYGPGHNSFTLSPDSKETWILFHAKKSPEPGWSDRRTHAQIMFFDNDGAPLPMKPLPPERNILLPSGIIR